MFKWFMEAQKIEIMRPTGFDLMYYLNTHSSKNYKVTRTIHDDWCLLIYNLPNTRGAEVQIYNDRELLEFAISVGFTPESLQ
jgi:hypothetical protein